MFLYLPVRFLPKNVFILWLISQQLKTINVNVLLKKNCKLIPYKHELLKPDVCTHCTEDNVVKL